MQGNIGSVPIVTALQRPEAQSADTSVARVQRTDKAYDGTISENLRRPDGPEYVSRGPEDASGGADNFRNPRDFRRILEERIASDSQDRPGREQSDCEKQQETSAKTDRGGRKKPSGGTTTVVMPIKPVPDQTTVVPGIKANAGKPGSGDNLKAVGAGKAANSTDTGKITGAAETSAFAGTAQVIKAAEPGKSDGKSMAVGTTGTTTNSPRPTGTTGAVAKVPNTGDSSQEKIPADAAQSYTSGKLQNQDTSGKNGTEKASQSGIDVLGKSQPAIQTGTKPAQATDMKQGADMKKEHTDDGMFNKANTPARTAPANTAPASNPQTVGSAPVLKPAQSTGMVVPSAGTAAGNGSTGGINSGISPLPGRSNLEISPVEGKGGPQATGKNSSTSEVEGPDPADHKKIQKLVDNLAERLADGAQNGSAATDGAAKSVTDSVVAWPLRTVSVSTQTASQQRIGIRSVDPVGIGQALNSRNTAAIGPHQQVIEHISINKLQSPDQRITIVLNPPELGKVSIRFQRSGEEITGIIEVEKAQTRYDIERHLPQVIMSMENNGLNVRRIQVTTTEQQHNNSHRNMAEDPSANNQSADYQQRQADAQSQHNSSGRPVQSRQDEFADLTAQGRLAAEHAEAEDQSGYNAINVYI